MAEGSVLITGASRGLGRALAEAFAAGGAPVAICARGKEELAGVAKAIRARGGRCAYRAVDVADAAAVGAWVAEAEREFGAPRVLINNASLLGSRVPLTEYPLERWREVLEVNLTGALIVTQAVVAGMVARGDGCIINVSSGAAVPPRAAWGAYAVSKDALEGLSWNLAKELATTGVRVNVVDPGSMQTGMRAAAYPAEDPAGVKPPEAAAPLFLWLAGDAARGVTGERFRVDDWHAPPAGTA